MFPRNVMNWFRGNKKERETTRYAVNCYKCKQMICYGFDKSGTFIFCPKCRASVKLPDRPVMTKQESDTGVEYQTVIAN